jgi:hypothetical protein
MARSKLTVKASDTLVAAFVDDGQGPRVVLAPVERGFFGDRMGHTVVIGTSRDEVRGVIRALAACLEEMPGAAVVSPSDDRTKRVTSL